MDRFLASLHLPQRFALNEPLFAQGSLVVDYHSNI
ncbi:MAG: hypothetical protein FD159_211 [Syntrophaceae bacterium]|nr:MAG: hypothetical protein FD159_211 [Syntrophaceae bacterium]